MGTVRYETVAGNAHIRLSNGITNTLTTNVLEELSEAIDRSESESRGILLCGGEKFFPMVLTSNGRSPNPEHRCDVCFWP